MAQVSLQVNGKDIVADVEPRMSLADFVRGELHLTGTHLGCEQGVCGACTVLIDGSTQRACLAFTVDCSGSSVTTIEGFDEDAVMGELREAFSEFHALQCGFCTPGMLATARDIVLRLGELPDARIREELGGNLCRCTGYVGIVAAIRKVAAGRKPNAAAAASPVIAKQFEPKNNPAAIVAKPALAPAAAPAGQSDGGTSIEESIRVAASPAEVWAIVSDLQRVVPCVPGAEIVKLEGDSLTGKVRIALGPIKASFQGQAVVGRDDDKREGWMSGRGRDPILGSTAEGSARWQVIDGGQGDTLVAVTLSWKLSGALAQFNRGGLVQDIVRRLAATFAANLEAAITGTPSTAPKSSALGGFGLIWSLIKAWFARRSN
jgi:carbon-monoxide dehydrogenase small subunit